MSDTTLTTSIMTTTTTVVKASLISDTADTPVTATTTHTTTTATLTTLSYLTLSVDAGATVLHVASTSALTIGMPVMIDVGTPLQENNTVAGFGSVILMQPLKYSHSADAKVWFSHALVP